MKVVRYKRVDMRNIQTFISAVALIFIFNIESLAQSGRADSSQEKTEKVKLKVTGMTCAGCANHIHKALSEKKGIVDNEVKYPGDIAIITYRPGEIKLEEIIRAIEKGGYKVKKLKS